MKKTGALISIFWAIAQLVQAQLPTGANAPNFVATDINGQAHNLYEVLNANKIVLLEVSATWCPPCWAYHQSKAMQDFYAEHGPAGDDKARVFWVEGDPNTNLACLYGQAGCNNNSSGNFVENAPYPILNSSAIADAFQVSYYPTIFVICPNKKVYEIDPLSATDLWEKAQVCPVAFGSNNAGIFAHDPGYDLPEICGGVALEPSFLLTNLGSEPLTSANILLKWNGSVVESIDWQGNLPTYGEALIQFDSYSVNEAGVLNTIVTSINNNAGDDDFTNNYQNNSYTTGKHFDNTKIVLKIKTDSYGQETYWELRDENGAVLDRGGNQLVGPNGGGAFPLGIAPGPGAYTNNTLVKDTLSLPASGCYSIHFVDAFGDGMCCNYGNGYFKLYTIDNPATPIMVGGQFEDYERHAFEAGMVSTNAAIPVEELHLQVFPNPASDMLYLNYTSETNTALQLQLLNALGQTVLERQTEQFSQGENAMEISLNGIPDGLYFLVLRKAEDSGRPVVQKVVVQR